MRLFVTTALPLLLSTALAQTVAPPPGSEPPPHPAATLQLGAEIPWRTDGQEFYEQERGKKPIKVDRMALVDQACAEAKAKGTLVAWYIHRIQEKGLQGRQMYRAPVLDIYCRQVLFGDPDIGELLTHAFVPLRCVMDQALSDRFGLKPLAFVEPAVVFLDGDGKVVHFVERIRTFHGPWFADLCVRVLQLANVQMPGEGVDGLRQVGRWQEALALAQKEPDKKPADWLPIARLQRLLRQYEQALDSLQKAEGGGDDAGDGAAPARRRRARGPGGDLLAERGLLLTLQGQLLAAQPVLEAAWRSNAPRAAEAGYWHALNTLRLGNEVAAMRRFQAIEQRFPGTPFGKRARANTVLGPDDRPLGAAFTGFESLAVLPEAAWHGLPKDTQWQGDRLSPAAMARGGVEFLLAQQRDDGGFTDARYAYWPSSEITPNVWVAITALCCTALWEQRAAHPDLAARIDLALQRGEQYLLEPEHLNRGANEDCYSDAYRLLYFARRANGGSDAERQRAIAQMNAIVQAATSGQKASGFFSHEYENAFATAAVVQELLVAKAAGAAVPTEVTDKAAAALLSARMQNGTYAYGGAAREGTKGNLKDSAGRMPVCEGTLFQLGRSDLDKVRAAMQNFWDHMKNLEGVRRNDFHSDGELGGFFFFHSVFHASEVVHLLPDAERPAEWQRFQALLQQIPELDGSFLDSHELGRSYGTAMALLTLANCVRR